MESLHQTSMPREGTAVTNNVSVQTQCLFQLTTTHTARSRKATGPSPSTQGWRALSVSFTLHSTHSLQLHTSGGHRALEASNASLSYTISGGAAHKDILAISHNSSITRMVTRTVTNTQSHTQTVIWFRGCLIRDLARTGATAILLVPVTPLS